jgi:AcrR family transcriptional regulator
VSTGTRLPGAVRREQILDATKEIALARGFHAVSIDAVARAAGISRPIVYGHFRDLAGLLDALVEREDARAREQLRAVVPMHPEHADLRETLIDATRRYLEAAQGDPDTWRLVLMPPEGAPESMRATVESGREEVLAGMRATIGPLLTARDVPDPDLVVRILSQLADDAVRLLLTDPERYPVERLLATTRWMLGRLV